MSVPSAAIDRHVSFSCSTTAITDGLQRGVVLVIDVHAHTVGLAVAPAVAVTFTRAQQRRFVATEVLPRVARDDVSDAVEVGTQELRRALNDPTVPPAVTVTTS